MIRNLLFSIFCFCSIYVQAQSEINQVIIANGGQFGNPTEQCNLASFNPVTSTYTVFDTIPVNSVQHLLVEGNHLYVAAQNFIVKYDLDTYERLFIADFPGLSTHQLALFEDKLLATNFYGQTIDNLYIFSKTDLTLIDTVQEVKSPGGTMAIVGNRLFIGQNNKGNIDACPPNGCYNDTTGYLTEIDLVSNQWVQDIMLTNNGLEVGRLLTDGTNIYCLNEVSNSITTFNSSTEVSSTSLLTQDITTGRYRNEAIIQDGNIIALFNGGIGKLSTDLTAFSQQVDTFAIAFALDTINNQFYITATDFFSYTSGYTFSEEGAFLHEMPTGISPEAIAIQYNQAPEITNVELNSQQIITIDLSELVTDRDGDSIIVESILTAPLNGVVSILNDGNVQYTSLSPGSSDYFVLNICDNKLNKFCDRLQVTILGITGLNDSFNEYIEVYPNPVSKHLFIKSELKDFQMFIHNSSGENVKTIKNKSTVEIVDLPNGSYYLTITAKELHETFRFVKQ